MVVLDPRGRAAFPAPSGIQVLDENPPEHDESQISLTISDNGDVMLEVGGDHAQAPTHDDSFDANLAERLDDGALAALASMLMEGIEADIQARREWEDTANKAAKYLGIKLEDPSSDLGADGTVMRTVASCLLEAVVKSWSAARAELLPVGGPVKVKRDDLPVPGTPGQAPAGMGHNGGPALDPTLNPAAAAPPPVPRDDIANALEQDMNWFLTVGDRAYYPDFSKMLFHRALIGMAFRKVYRCPVKRRPASVWVRAQNLVVSSDCTHLADAERVTEIIRMRQSVMRRMQANGDYRDVMLAAPSNETTETEEATAEIEGVAAGARPEDAQHMLYECTTELDSFMLAGLEILDKDENGKKPGYPLPYRVTIDKDSRDVLEIRRAWKKGDEEHTRKTRYVKYGFVPGLGFYDLGLIHMAGNPTMVATMLERSGVDAALFANFPGGLYAQTPGTHGKNTVFRPGPGEFCPVPMLGGTDISKAIMPMPYKPPSAEAMALGSAAAQKVRDLAGIISLPVGEGRIGNTPVGTIMSYIEAVSQVPGAVHKDDHVAQAEEFQLLRDLFAEEPDALTRGNKTPARKWQIAEEMLAPDLTAAADPNTPSAVHRLMKLQAMVTLSGLPQFVGIADPRAIYAQAVRLLASGNAGDFTLPPKPQGAVPPDPKVMTAQIRAQSDAASVEAKTKIADLEHQGRLAEIQAEREDRERDRHSDEVRDAMKLQQSQIKAAADAELARSRMQHEAGIAGADRQHAAEVNAAKMIAGHIEHLDKLQPSGIAASQPASFSAPFSGGQT